METVKDVTFLSGIVVQVILASMVLAMAACVHKIISW